MLLLVRTALDRGLITKGDAAETLGTSIEEIRQLLVRPQQPARTGTFKTTLKPQLLQTVIIETARAALVEAGLEPGAAARSA